MDKVTATQVWPTRGPAARDELAAWSTATLSDTEPGAVPGFGQPQPPGWTELVRGRGMYIRRRPGPRDATPAWYVHGLAGSSTNWTRLAAALSPAATGYSVDLPGHGRSDPPPRGRYSLHCDAELIAATIEQVSGGPVHLVGNSFGGIIATLLAAARPDLVSTLTVISPAVPDLRLTGDRGADPRLGLLLVPGTAGLAYRHLATISPLSRARGMGELCFGDPDMLTDADYELAAEDLAWRSGLPWVFSATIGSLRALMAGYLRRGRSSFPAAAARVTVPTLVVWGTRDRLVDVRLARRTAEAFPRAELLILPGCGHVAQMEDPQTTARGVLALWEGNVADGSGAVGDAVGGSAAGAVGDADGGVSGDATDDHATTERAGAGAPRQAERGAVATSWA